MLPVQRRGLLLSAAIKTILGASAYSMLASAAIAQEATPTTTSLDEVVVTGFRASLEEALDVKRKTAASVDVIEAEDIAKFPDSNLAESIQRIPGVSIARDAGEGRNLTVRGLGPQFTRVRINGMEAMSTTGGTDSSGGANRNRSFDFNVFASELFNSITARKTASADVEEGSLGATIDLATARPFDHRGLTIAASVQGVYNDLAEEADPRASALISDTWADGKFGALVSVAYAKRTLLEEGMSTVRWDSGNSVGGFNGASTPTGITLAQANAPSTLHPRIPRYGQLVHDQERLGLTGALQWQASEGTLINFDALYSDFKANRAENYLEAFSFSRNLSQNGKPQTLIRSGILDGNGTLVYGLFDDVDIRSEARYDELETTFTQYTLSGSHDLGQRWTLSELIGYSKSDHRNPIQTTITLDRANSDNYSWDFRGNDRRPAFEYGFDTTNPANWVFANGQSEIRLRPQYVVNTFETAQFDVKFEINDRYAVKGGVSVKEYGFDSKEYRRTSETTVAALPTGVTLASVTTPVQNFGHGLNLPGATPATWLIPNIDAFNSVFNIYSNSGIYALSGVSNPNARGNIREVSETDLGGYAQFDFNVDIGPIPLRGDVGVRVAQTNQESKGYQLTGSAAVQVTAEHDYSDVLPSLNLVAELTPELLVRFGAAKVMTRPGLGNVTPGGSINLVGTLSITSGNPTLEPTRADAYDLAAEWYFDKGSLLSLALFYKDVKTFTQTLVEPVVFNETGLPLSLLAGTTLTGNEVFLSTRPVNTEGGPLQGFEINYQQPFRFLPGPFSNLGALINYTHVDSEIAYITSSTNPTPIKNDLTGLSQDAYNATLYYEDDHFSVRISGAYRSSYLTRVPASNAPTILDAEGTNETFNVDLSASYNINDSWAVSLEALNLTDEFNDQFIDTNRDLPVVDTHTGRIYFLGVRYKL